MLWMYDSEPDLWTWDLDVDGNYCPHVPRPSFQARQLDGLIFSDGSPEV